jgi:hypothetical protein
MLRSQPEAAGEAAFVDFAVAELASLLGSDFARRVKPLGLHRWGSDPFARGSYSYALPGQAACRGALAATVDFAGGQETVIVISGLIRDGQGQRWFNLALCELVQVARNQTVRGEIDNAVLVELCVLDGGFSCIQPELYILGCAFSSAAISLTSRPVPGSCGDRPCRPMSAGGGSAASSPMPHGNVLALCVPLSLTIPTNPSIIRSSIIVCRTASRP